MVTWRLLCYCLEVDLAFLEMKLATVRMRMVHQNLTLRDSILAHRQLSELTDSALEAVMVKSIPTVGWERLDDRLVCSTLSI